ncbi:phosphatidylinositol 4-phosphate 5-kinase 8-like isoform X8 [Durio zibethinus]|uniref:1-phosphatidylinositol-4-phosphate 5-kinase n=1 Tax=Durio zibethinus TaxID=66656 RepID=A0A6P5Z881_DURZI|nr:phosphatidylinositol 4-phosphate 5-kinase 8-like isoform X8 [Durio zibethinus]
MTRLKNLFDEGSGTSTEQLDPVSCVNVENVERLNEKAFSNGDLYVGDFKEILPHSKGKYTWSDGTVYEGDWEAGKMTGKGLLHWPSGAKYNGDISGGYLHGFGAFTAPDGSIYEGQWRMNIRHGFGRKKYSNSDVYEGEWKEGVHEVHRYTVGKITPVPKREVRNADFGDRARITMFFPRRGSQFTPLHKSIDFYWKDYCPMVFRNLREMFKLDAAEYMMSICGDDGLTEISSPGKSGSIFYLSHDDKFVIKTLKRSELKVLLKMLPNYYNHVKEYENTLITKFFGLHRITLAGRRKVRFMVMGNMFCTELRIHHRYDLKGSTHGRYTEKDKIHENTTLKDLDLSYEFHMDKSLRKFLFYQIDVDCKFLKSQQIIDYSLLLGLHFRAPKQLNGLLEPPNMMPNIESSPTSHGMITEELLFPSKGLLLVAHEPSSVNTEPGPHIRGKALRAYSLGDKEVDVLVPGTGRLRVQLGVNMPAQANHKLYRDETDSAEVELFEVYDVVLYMGIIDILQEYNAKKKAENACKSVKYDPLSISAVEPELYARRFIGFLQQKVFPELP